MRVQLTDVKGTGAISERLSGLSIYADVDAVQDTRLGGIEFALGYMNQGRRDVELFNPIDYIQYMILDAAGYPIKTPPYAPRLLIHSEDELVEGLKDKFLIVSIRQNDSDKDVQEEVREKTSTLGPSASYTVTLRILKIIDARSPDTPINIPPGSYKIVLTCALVTPANADEQGNNIRMLQSEEIPLELR